MRSDGLAVQAGMVFKVDQDATESLEHRKTLGAVLTGDDTETSSLSALAQALVWVAIALILSTTVVCVYVEFRLIIKSRKQVKKEKANKRASYLAMVVDSVPLHESVAFKQALHLVVKELRHRDLSETDASTQLSRALAHWPVEIKEQLQAADAQTESSGAFSGNYWCQSSGAVVDRDVFAASRTVTDEESQADSAGRSSKAGGLALHKMRSAEQEKNVAEDLPQPLTDIRVVDSISTVDTQSSSGASPLVLVLSCV